MASLVFVDCAFQTTLVFRSITNFHLIFALGKIQNCHFVLNFISPYLTGTAFRYSNDTVAVGIEGLYF